MISKFTRPGTEVVCVDNKGVNRLLKKDCVYTVVKITDDILLPNVFYAYVSDGCSSSGGFYLSRFDYLHKKKTDISIFHEILNRVNAKEPV